MSTGDAIHVLHVDDEPEFAEMAATFLEREDDRFAVETAATASEGLAHLADEEVDCVVSDHDLPDRTGIEFLEAVREQHPDLPFVLYTGKGSEEVTSDAISAGVTDYLQKEGGTDQYTILANRVVNAAERYRIQRDATRTRKQLQAISEHSADAIVIIDADSRIRFANPAVEDHFGYTPSELRDEPLTTIMPERYRADHLAGIDRYIATGERSLNWSNVEFPGERRDGTEIPISVSFGEFRQDGERRFIGILRDITDRTRLEAELREREERFRQLAENISEVVWMSDPEKSEMIYANPAYEDVWGHSVESLYEDPTRFLDSVHPEDRDRVESALDLQLTGEYDVEYRIVRPDGEVRWIRDQAVPVRNDAGDVYRIVGIASDITERRAREQELVRMRDLLERTERLANVGGWEIETETMEVFWTEHLFELLGVEYDEEPSLDEALDVYHEDDRHIVEDAVDRALDSGEPFDVEVRFRRSNDDVRWLRVIGTPTVEDGDVVSLRGAVRDVTDRKRHQRTLERTKSRLEAVASIVSDDLRKPLKMAEESVELARADRDGEHLERAARSHERIAVLVDDILALAREDERVGELEAVDLPDLLDRCWTTVDTGDGTLVMETERSVKADRDRLHRLLETFIRNAVDHGGADVTVTVGELENGFYVEDDGPGIPAEDRETAFEAGYSTAERGTGFGLSIVKRIVEAHDWAIRVADGSEGGARFEITGVEVDEA